MKFPCILTGNFQKAADSAFLLYWLQRNKIANSFFLKKKKSPSHTGKLEDFIAKVKVVKKQNLVH